MITVSLHYSLLVSGKNNVEIQLSDVPRFIKVYFEGIPGSGKTHLVKSLLNDINDTMFILVPPELVKQ